MIQNMLRAITAKYHLNGITLGEFSRLKVNGTNFDIWAFHADGLGHVSAMTASGFLGLTRMETLIITPTERDMPLLSYHRNHARGNDTLRFDLYDTLLEPIDLRRVAAVQESCAALPDQDPDSHWCDSLRLAVSLAKQGKRDLSAEFDRCALDYLHSFLETAEDAPYCDPAEKQAKASVYVEGLLHNGSSTTDLFKKHLGEEKTGLLLRNILFGTAR